VRPNLFPVAAAFAVRTHTVARLCSWWAAVARATLLAVSSLHSTDAEATEPTPDLGSRMRSGSAPGDDAPYDVWTVAGERGALLTQPHAERLIGGTGSTDRESALVEAGRLYGRDHARARAALADGSHPLCRLKRPEG
jgi:hypothetical protein